jgi:hypothetical protein
MMGAQIDDEICYNNRFSPKGGIAGQQAKKKKDEWASSQIGGGVSSTNTMSTMNMINRQGSKKGIGMHIQQNPVMAQFITSKNGNGPSSQQVN